MVLHRNRRPPLVANILAMIEHHMCQRRRQSRKPNAISISCEKEKYINVSKAPYPLLPPLFLPSILPLPPSTYVSAKNESILSGPYASYFSGSSTLSVITIDLLYGVPSSLNSPAVKIGNCFEFHRLE